MNIKLMSKMYEEKEDHKSCNLSHKTCIKNDNKYNTCE